MNDIVPMVISAVLGAVLGWERQVGRKAAGLRTHALVCIGSTLFVLTALHAAESVASGTWDPTRIVHGIVTGVGFLGAGSILRHEGFVLGLTTAASIWTVAAIGAAVGVRAYILAVASTLLALIVLKGFRKIDQWLAPHSEENGPE